MLHTRMYPMLLKKHYVLMYLYFCIIHKSISFKFQVTWFFEVLISVTIMCRNDKLSSTMSWVNCFLKDSEFFILFAENSQMLLKISVIPILLTFIYLVAHNLLVNNQQLIIRLNLSLRHIIVTKVRWIFLLFQYRILTKKISQKNR